MSVFALSLFSLMNVALKWLKNYKKFKPENPSYLDNVPAYCA